MLTQRINQHMITLARESRGFTQSELAKMLKVTQGKISKIEMGLLNPSDTVLKSMASILEYPTSFFYQTGNIYSLGIAFYRKHKTLSKNLLTFLNANINIQRIRVQKLLSSIDISLKLRYYDIEKYQDPEKIAQLIRKLWNVGKGPIDDLTTLLEDAGIIVVHCDLGTPKFSGVSALTENGVYIIFVNANMPGDRLRFTLAHELGHILMHRQVQSDDMEDEADRFASEILMPKEDISYQLYKLSLEKLSNLKVYWKVSMQAILKRAQQLDKITPRYARYLWMQMGKYGYRTHEPVGSYIPAEKTTLLKEIINIHLQDLGYTIGSLCNYLNCSKDDLNDLYHFESKNKLKLISIKKSRKAKIPSDISAHPAQTGGFNSSN